jgi:ABC-type transport system involved in multi-copper enzyme maturation permease subunit
VTTVAVKEPGRAAGSERLPFRLPRAELLKLRKRRGLVVAAALLTIGAVCIALIALELFHLSNSVKYGPVGGTDHFRHLVFVLAQLGSVAAALIGATAGAGDLGAGVFRELVATGRPRLTLFAARVPGGLALLWPLIAVAYLILAIATVAAAGGLPTPSVHLFVVCGLWILLATSLAYCLGLGLGSLIGSRSTSIAVLFGWIIIVEPILAHITPLGRARDALLNVSLDHVAPSQIVDRDLRLPMSAASAVLVMLAWAIIPLAAGAWRTMTRDA